MNICITITIHTGCYIYLFAKVCYNKPKLSPATSSITLETPVSDIWLFRVFPFVLIANSTFPFYLCVRCYWTFKFLWLQVPEKQCENRPVTLPRVECEEVVVSTYMMLIVVMLIMLVTVLFMEMMVIEMVWVVVLLHNSEVWFARTTSKPQNSKHSEDFARPGKALLPASLGRPRVDHTWEMLHPAWRPQMQVALALPYSS